MSDFNRTINIYVESGAAQQAYDVLAKRQANLTAETAEYIAKGKDIPEKLTKKLEDVTAALDRQAKKLSGELSPSYKDLTGTVANLTKEVSRMSAQDAGYAKKTKELTEAKEAANAYRNSVINVGAAMKQVEKESGGFGAHVKEVFTGMLEFEAVKEGLKKIYEKASESIELFEKFELADKQLAASLIETGTVGTEAMEKLKKQAIDLEKTSIFGRATTERTQARLAIFGLSSEQIAELMPKIANLASSPMMNGDMERATEAVVKGLAGTAKGLKETGMNTDVVAGDVKGNLEKISIGLKKFDGDAELLAKSGIGRSKVLANEINAQMASVGKYLVVAKEAATDFVLDVINNLQPLKDAFLAVYNAVSGVYTKFKEVAVGLGLVSEKGQVASMMVKGLTLVFDATMIPLRIIIGLVTYLVAGFERAAAAAVGLKMAFTALTTYFSDTAHKVFGGIAQAVEGVFTLNIGKITAGLNQSKSAFQKAGADVAEAFKAGYNGMMSKFKAAGEGEKPEEEMKVGGKNTGNSQVEKEKADKMEKELEAFKKFYASREKLHEEALHASDTAEDKETFAIAEKYKEGVLALNEFYKNKIISREQFDQTMKLMNDTYVKETEAVKPKHDYENELKAAEVMNVAMLKLNDQRLLKGEISEIEYNARLKVLEETNLQTKTAIAKKYAPIYEKAKEDQVAFEKAANQKQVADYLAHIADLKAADDAISKYRQDTAKINAAIAGKGAKDETVEKLKALDEWHQAELKKTKGNLGTILALQADFEAKKQQIIEEGNRQTLDTIAKDIKEYGGDVIKVLSGISKIMENNENYALKSEKKSNDTKLLQYKHMLDSKQITQKKYDQMVEAANEEMAKKEEDLKRKQFERNKAIKIAEAVINTAAAVLQALANNPPPLSYALAAVAGVLGGVEIGVIASEQYADGTASYGDTLPGQPHSAGGNPILDSKTGQKIGEVERGEAIIPADAAKNNPDVIRQLLTTGRKKNLINQMHPVRQLDQSRNLENISGAQNQSAYHQSAAGSTSANSSSDSTSQYLQELIHIGREHITETKKVGEKQPVISLTDFHKKEKDYKFILDKQI